ncbi:30S ribosome-binding factor RbfA [Cryptosporangium aurantiacum]|uniref:Ribosome-binding factor A n=1 Tax=Cryptosporangium aurantiacum TaxID=134849 RepID=A0A1M7IP88_9ACTN|nr:30S ribosome-binding factor RbfA [Cryptosporangium aurantiacum]SHM42624.1 ribosome-binding factor A [Cryptosporangium aurantiacum]
MADAARARKLAVRIREIVAETLRTQVKDPRLGMVTVTDAKVTADLHDATVYYTVYGDDAERAATAAALESARGVLRSAVGRQTGVRFTPTLTFSPDEVPDTAKHIDDLLAEARRADAEVQRQAVGANYAGEADPYKHEDDDEDAPAEEPVDVPDRSGR